MSPIRKRFGLRWRKSFPTLEDFDNLTSWLLGIMVAVVLIVLYGLVDANDRRVEAEIDALESSAIAAHILNGGTLTNPEQTVAVKCLQVLEVTN